MDHFEDVETIGMHRELEAVTCAGSDQPSHAGIRKIYFESTDGVINTFKSEDDFSNLVNFAPSHTACLAFTMTAHRDADCSDISKYNEVTLI